ncbi:MAG TPA: BTAD domain-containing putative transcriptional regulator [Clostridia bacterium]|nr:BTAD domain-containing putative transcriptional regulator [Clostridia bacterium]
MSKLHFSLLGSPDIYFGEECITEEFSSKSLALVFYLIMNNSKCFTRDYLGNLLWPGSSRKATYSNLRYNLWKINNIFEKYYELPVINSKNDRIAFCEGIKYTLDIENLRSLLDQKSIVSVKKVNMMYPGDFLEGFYLKKCLDYNDWIFYERESIQRLYYEILEDLLKKYKNKSLFYDSIDTLKTMLKINPFNEILYQEIIELFLKKGDKTDALNYYNKCVNTLRENLNISPKKSTRELLERIKNSSKEKEKEYLNLNVFCKDYIEQDFYYINELLKQIYEVLGGKIKKQINQNYLCEISKVSLVYENLLDDKELRRIDNRLKNIRLFDAIEEYFIVLSQLYKINIGISNYQSIDQETRIMIERIKTIENIEIKIV